MNGLDEHDTLLYSLTYPQKRIWTVEQIFPNSSIHNIGGVSRIQGSLDFEKMEQAIRLFIQSHEGIRLRLVEDSRDVKQFVCNAETAPLDKLDFSQEDNPYQAFEAWVSAEAAKPFDLEGECLYYFSLFSLTDSDNGFFVKLHHLIADGWSMAMLTKQIWNLYTQLLRHEEAVPVSAPPYSEYIAQEANYLSSRRFEQDRSFWLQKFRSLPDAAPMRSTGIRGRRASFQLFSELTSALKGIAARHSYSLNTIFIALHFLYSYKVTGRQDDVIGTPVFNRNGALQKNIFGMFTGTMPFRFQIQESWTIREMLSQLQAEVMLCYKHHKYPYNLLLTDLHGEGFDRKSLFDISVNYYNTRHVTELIGIPLINTEFYNGEQLYEMQWIIRDWSDDGNLLLDIDYQTDAYSEQQIEQIYDHIVSLLELIIHNPDAVLMDISLVSPEEQQWQLNDFNCSTAHYPSDQTISQLFEEQVRKTPSRIAVSCGSASITYQELNNQTDRLAALLRQKGVRSGSVVAVYMNHSIETVIAILGIFKAGGAYLPLDPSMPEERLSFMAKDAEAKIMLTNLTPFPFTGEVLRMDKLSEQVGVAERMRVCWDSSDLAYIIYTSGSTGKPKGTLIRQWALVNYICWAMKQYVKQDPEIFALYSSLAFDLTVTSIFTPLLSGGQIAVYPEDGEHHAIYRIMSDNLVTVLKLTPSHLALLKDGDYQHSSVRRLIVGGEDFKTALAADVYAAWNGNVEILNEYGPTEATVGCMIYQYDPEKDTHGSLPIGHPADNVQIYVLNAHKKLLPRGCIGEIYISGDGLADGYLNRPEMTAASFLDHPYIAGKKLYRTGDLGRFRDDGTLEYKNRADAQLSIRGYRIEPGEIENALLAHSAISEAAVVSYSKNNNPQLVAYIVVKHDVRTKVLKDFLAATLPYYMIPLHIVSLDIMPVTRNGKLNRSLFPEPPSFATENATDNSEAIGGEGASALIEALRQILGISKIGLYDNFYQLGGDSIKAIQIVSLLRAKGFRLTANDILTYPIIETMITCIRSEVIEERRDAVQDGSIRKTPVISWFFDQGLDQARQYHHRVLLEMRLPVSKGILETIMNSLIRHHDALRINLEAGTSQIKYNNNHLSNPFRIQKHMLSHLSPEQRNREMMRIAEAMESGQNLYTDLLFQAAVFVMGKRNSYLLITAHHLVVDGVSWRILLEDLNRAARQLMTQQDISFPAKTLSYQQWAEKLEKHARMVKDKEQEHWERVLAGAFRFPDRIAAADAADGEGWDSFRIQLSEEDTIKLLTTANAAFMTRPHELIITALLLTIKEYTGRDDIILDLEGHGRDELEEGMDVSRTVGWFTSIFPFAIQLTHSDLAQTIKQVKEQLRSIPANGIGYGILRYITDSLTVTPDRELLFNYLGEFDEAVTDDIFVLADHPAMLAFARSKATHAMEINAAIIDRTLSLMLTYRRAKYSSDSMGNFMLLLQSNVLKIVEFCGGQSEPSFTPSDFDGACLSQSELDSIFSD